MGKLKKTGFSLLEIIIAIVIFGIIITITIELFKNINNERKISVEKAEINEKITILEKNIRDYITSANLSLEPTDKILSLESNFDVVRPYYIPTAIIIPSIYQTQSNHLVIFCNSNIQNNPNPNQDRRLMYMRIRSMNNNIIIEQLISDLNLFNDPLRGTLRLNSIRNGNTLFWYFSLSNSIDNLIQNMPRQNLIIQTIDFNSSNFENSNYVINLTFQRYPLATMNNPIIPEPYRDIIYQTHGNVTNLNDISNFLNVQNPIIANPNILYAEVRIGLYQGNRRRLFFTRTMSFYVKHKSII